MNLDCHVCKAPYNVDHTNTRKTHATNAVHFDFEDETVIVRLHSWEPICLHCARRIVLFGTPTAASL